MHAALPQSRMHFHRTDVGMFPLECGERAPEFRLTNVRDFKIVGYAVVPFRFIFPSDPLATLLGRHFSPVHRFSPTTHPLFSYFSSTLRARLQLDICCRILNKGLSPIAYPVYLCRMFLTIPDIVFRWTINLPRSPQLCTFRRISSGNLRILYRADLGSQGQAEL